jgi:glutathione synthase/RimK-type ligase-like ATP-grasp enzyme
MTAVSVSGAPGAGVRSHRNPERLVVLHDNLAWIQDLLAELRRRSLPFDAQPIDGGWFDPDQPPPWSLAINRVSPSAALRGPASIVPYTREYLEHLEGYGVRILNGVRAFHFESSKTAQLALIRSEQLRAPRTLVLHRGTPPEALDSWNSFPAILKPNTGGSGAGVQLVRDRQHLREILTQPTGPSTEEVLLLQEHVRAADGTQVRLEFVAGKLLYAQRIHAQNTFALCPAEGCPRPPTDPTQSVVVSFELERRVPTQMVSAARSLLTKAGMDIGAVEYVETPDGPVFLDLNANSVYRQAIAFESGVNPYQRIGEYIDRLATSRT